MIDRPRPAVVLSRLMFVLLAVVVATAAGADEYRRGDDVAGRSQSPVYARRGVVSSGQPLATQTGLSVLQNGGNAADAAIATAAALSVLEPMRSGLGGDISLLYWDEKGTRLHGFESRGQLPAAIARSAEKPPQTDDAKRDGKSADNAGGGSEPPADEPKTGETGDWSGARSWTPPGTVDGWHELHARFGSVPWDELLKPAITFANDGFPVSVTTAKDWARHAPRLSGTGASALLPDGAAPKAGTLARNKDLGRTLATLASDGRAVFYEGELGQTLVAFGHGLGSLLTADDLAQHHGAWSDPVSVSYRDVDVITMSSSPTGISALQTLGILSAYDIKNIGRKSPQFFHLLIEAKSAATSDRLAEKPLPLGTLLSPEHAADRRRAIDPNKATKTATALQPQLSGRGSAVIVIDAAGNACILVQDLGNAFGSGVVPGAMGFVMQERVMSRAANGRPMLRPHSRTLAMLSTEGRPTSMIAAGGGVSSTELLVQAIVSLVDFQLDVQSAIDVARLLHVSGQKPAGRLIAEPGLADAVIDGLKTRGHVVASPMTVDVGELQIATRPPLKEGSPSDAVLSIGSDPRHDAGAAGY